MEGEDLDIGGQLFRIRVEPARGRNAYAIISGAEIRIRIPLGMGRRESERCFMELRERVIRKIMRHPEVRWHSNRGPEFSAGQEFGVLGQPLRIEVSEDLFRRRNTAKIDGAVLRLLLAGDIPQSSKASTVNLLAHRAISRHFLPEIENRVSRINAESFGFDLKRVSLKRQSTRWGSCSKRSGRINLNFRLLFAPEGILDYVITHELAHLKESNHSQAFWRLVGTAMPDYKERARWLRKNGGTICPSSATLPDSSSNDEQRNALR